MSALLSALALAATQVPSPVSPPTQPPLETNPVIAAREKAAGLRLDDLFPRKPFFGKGATGLSWSPDDRYLAYLWNPYDDKAMDLWLYDANTRSSRRMTSIEMMARYDRTTRDAIERYRKDKIEEDKSLKMNDLEYREWRLKRKEENEKRKEPLPSYPGVSDVTWSPKKNELLFTSRGDIYRWDLAKKAPERLTRTQEPESQVKYLPDGSGFTYRRGGGVFRVRFDSAATEQLNPELPDGLPLAGYNLSPDGTKLMIRSSKSSGPSRQVEYISYRGRFATAKKAEREVADDEFKDQSYLFLYDLTNDSLDGYKGDGKPWEVWKWPGGKEWMETSVNERPWSPDSKRFTFATWKRTSRDFEIVVADVAAKKLKTIYRSKPDGEHTTPGMARPFFTPDGKNIVALLDATGFREPWLLDPAMESAVPIVTGEFETYPLRMSPDGSTLFVTSNKDMVAREKIYAVDMKTRSMKRLSAKEGNYTNPEISKSGKRIAARFGNFSSPPELVVLGRDERPLTSSHRPEFAAVNTLRPQFFRYPNRYGQNINGFMFLPPGWKQTDRRPLMIYVYGGPLGTGKSVEDGAFNSTAYLFNMYLARVFGYVTVTIDPRGGSGYGNVFGKANWQKPGTAQVEDLSDGVKYLVANYGVDPKKVGINGWSFGGFQTQMAMYTAPDVFTLGIAGAGPTEWQNYNNWYSGGVIGPSPNFKPEDLDKYSLTNLAKNLRSPLMLLHGMEDTNVLFQDTVNVYRKLLQYGKGPLVELALDPTGGHGMGGDMDTRDRHAIYLGFLQKWWGPYQP